MKWNFLTIFKKKLLPSESIVYSEEILKSSTVNLVGRPAEYRILNGVKVPVAEIKTYMSDDTIEAYTMQLMAYCMLMEESTGIVPPGGILKYMDKEIKIAYTSEAKRAVVALVREIEYHKASHTEFHCNHPEHI